uniref:Uncharacterized protein n=1 Tax=uncultured Desulfobacterium sp. TaxID=201089 RepID=E1YMP6_9BACT|nr:unknown protein [uncultured Desulfobacterium sp.]
MVWAAFPKHGSIKLLTGSLFSLTGKWQSVNNIFLFQ